jgi:hypothetical protein
VGTTGQHRVRQSEDIIDVIKAAGRYIEGVSEIKVRECLGRIKRAQRQMNIGNFDKAIEELSNSARDGGEQTRHA